MTSRRKFIESAVKGVAGLTLIGMFAPNVAKAADCTDLCPDGPYDCAGASCDVPECDTYGCDSFACDPVTCDTNCDGADCDSVSCDPVACDTSCDSGGCDPILGTCDLACDGADCDGVGCDPVACDTGCDAGGCDPTLGSCDYCDEGSDSDTDDCTGDDTPCDDTSCEDTPCDDTSCEDTPCDDTSCDDTPCDDGTGDDGTGDDGTGDDGTGDDGTGDDGTGDDGTGDDGTGDDGTGDDGTGDDGTGDDGTGDDGTGDDGTGDDGTGDDGTGDDGTGDDGTGDDGTSSEGGSSSSGSCGGCTVVVNGVSVSCGSGITGQGGSSSSGLISDGSGEAWELTLLLVSDRICAAGAKDSDVHKVQMRITLTCTGGNENSSGVITFTNNPIFMNNPGKLEIENLGTVTGVEAKSFNITPGEYDITYTSSDKVGDFVFMGLSIYQKWDETVEDSWNHDPYFEEDVSSPVTFIAKLSTDGRAIDQHRIVMQGTSVELSQYNIATGEWELIEEVKTREDLENMGYSMEQFTAFTPSVDTDGVATDSNGEATLSQKVFSSPAGQVDIRIESVTFEAYDKDSGKEDQTS